MKKILIPAITIIFVLLLNLTMLTKAEEASRLVISEIKVTGGSGKTTDEFVEIYNPADQDISLEGWRLIKKTAAGSKYALVSDFGAAEVKAHSFFLIAHPVGYLGAVLPDFYYTEPNSIASNNTVILVDGLGNEADKVGFGNASDFEGEVLPNLGSNKSAERKAKIDSTGETMVEGGPDYFLGNGRDSGNNRQDFIVRSRPDPQNSQSEIEYLDIAVPEIINPPEDEIIKDPENSAAEHSDKIIISELFPNPEGRDDDEFIELQNIGSAPVDLAGWQLGDNSTRRYSISFNDLSSTIIEAGGYLVVNKKISGISLNNSSDSAKLFYPDGTLAVSIEYADCPEGRSFSLVDGQWVWTDSVTPRAVNKFLIKNELPTAIFEIEEASLKVGQSIAFDASESGDPDEDKLEYFWEFGDGASSNEKFAEHIYDRAGIYNVSLLVRDTEDGEDEMELEIVVTDYDFSEKVIINELLPACTGPDADCEFIELFNFDAREVNLEGWQLTDLKSYYKFPEDSIIRAGSFLKIARAKSKITLNNHGDLVYLLDPYGGIVNGVEYAKAKKDISFSRSGDKWHWTEQPTPGEENIIMEDDQEVLASSEFENNEKPAELEKINLTPIELAIADINEQLLGEIIKVTGEVESAKSIGIYLMDEQGYLLRVYIQKKTKIPKPDVGPGDMMTVTGVLDKTSAGLRLLPRTPEDIIVTKRVTTEDRTEGEVLGVSTERDAIDFPENNQASQVKLYLYITAGVLIAGLGGWLVKLHLRNKTDKFEEIN